MRKTSTGVINYQSPCLSVTMNEHHLGAVFEDQVSDSTVGQSDAHQVLTLQRQNLHKQKQLSMSITLTKDIQYTTFKANVDSTSRVHPG